ncbi:MAG: GNAT family N-acetyltransferase [Bacilli bacterium]|nr:GNAT family N-acetyltransferase [Bacilli bacterium]
MDRLILIKPSIAYKEQILDMVKEWAHYNATHPTDPSPRSIFNKDYSNFEKYLDEFKQEEINPQPGFVPATTYFALDKERDVIVGAIQIRHFLNEHLRNSGGHIGDGVRPSERRKGYATEMIHHALKICKEMGIDRMMISCNESNIGSKKSILNNGGIFERTVSEDDEKLEIYWIDNK